MRTVATLALITLLASCGNGTSTPVTTPSSVVTTTSTSSSATTATTPATTATAPATTATTPATTTPVSNTGTVTYSMRTVGSLKGAVDVVERSSNDGFVYVVSRLGTVERWRHDGTRIDQVLDVASSTTGEGERGLLGLAFRRGATGAWAA